MRHQARFLILQPLHAGDKKYKNFSRTASSIKQFHHTIKTDSMTINWAPVTPLENHEGSSHDFKP